MTKFLKNLRNPTKRHARSAVNLAIFMGKLQKQPCEVCGEIKVHAHHTNYNDPLNIKWLCVEHHKQIHGGRFS